MSFTTPLSKKMYPRFVDMFEARGYTSITAGTLDGREDISCLRAKDASTPDSVILVFFEVLKFNVRDAEECINIDETEADRVIIVYSAGITCFARRIIDNALKFKMEYFPAKELESNIIKHEFQPRKFIKLKPHESVEFKKRWGEKFPKMLSVDKIARYYNFVQGDIIEIHRRNGDVVYRIVINPVQK